MKPCEGNGNCDVWLRPSGDSSGNARLCVESLCSACLGRQLGSIGIDAERRRIRKVEASHEFPLPKFRRTIPMDWSLRDKLRLLLVSIGKAGAKVSRADPRADRRQGRASSS